MKNESLQIVSNGQEPFYAPSVVINAGVSIELVEPLQPLPMASGRLRFIEFQVGAIQTHDSGTSLLVGVALPGIQGDWIGKTRGSVAVDFMRSVVYEGSRIALPLSSSISLVQGDTIGIGMSFECHDDELQMDTFFATYNGQLIFESRCLASANRGFFHIDIQSIGVSTLLTANQGASPFSFDLVKFQQSIASHPFYRTYLPYNPFNTEGTEIYWTHSRICHQYAFRRHYKPIEAALSKLPHSSFHERIASIQLQIFRWQKLIALFHRDETLNEFERLPEHFNSSIALHETLVTEDFKPFTIDFAGPIAQIRRSLLKSMTDLRYDIHLELLEVVAEHYSNRPSLFEDSDEIRSGLFEGHIKLALHLAESERKNATDHHWLALVQNHVFEDLLESKIDLSSACPGYLDVDQNGDGEDIAADSKDVSTVDGDAVGTTPGEEAADPDFEESENEIAERMVDIGAALRAWASWTGAYIGGLEIQFEDPHSTDSKFTAVPKDPTLAFLSKGLVNSLKNYIDAETELPIGARWLLMQYLSLGFGRDSPLNILPLTLEEAIDNAKSYFEGICSTITESDLETIRGDLKLLSMNKEHSDLDYLKHQWEFAHGAWPTDVQVCDLILSQLPKHIASILETELAPPPLPNRTHLTSSTSNASSLNQSNPSISTSSSWMVAAGIGIALLGASVGAIVAILATSRNRKSK